jgi:hypothetical protein
MSNVRISVSYGANADEGNIRDGEALFRYILVGTEGRHKHAKSALSVP